MYVTQEIHKFRKTIGSLKDGPHLSLGYKYASWNENLSVRYDEDDSVKYFTTAIVC